MLNDAHRPGWIRRDFLVGAVSGIAGSQAAGRLLANPHRLRARAVSSYGQCGEDGIVKLLFEDLGIGRPTYLDVGAYLPIDYNNTYLFYASGSRGVVVEPNVALIPALEAARPGDTILNVGIGVNDRPSADYYCMSLPEWNTFDRDEAERSTLKTRGRVKIERVIRMPLISINRIMGDHFPEHGPDFLSIDVEGLDLPILKSLDFERYRPRIICVETLAQLGDEISPDMGEFLQRVGYKSRAQTYANSIYVDAGNEAGGPVRKTRR